MGLRLIKKSILLAMRSRRRFIIFTTMYTVLMFWMSVSWENKDNSGSDYVIYSVLSTIALSVLYGWIITNYRKQEIATLKCIGYTNSNVRTLIVGELLWVTFVAFFIVVEILVHTTAIITYYFSQAANFPGNAEYINMTQPLLGIKTILITLALFLVSQLIGITIMYRRILNLRPIVALRVLK